MQHILAVTPRYRLVVITCLTLSNGDKNVFTAGSICVGIQRVLVGLSLVHLQCVHE